ncbi:transferase family hexapeptide repeat protein [Brevibacterium sanguinis]|uniref:Transferase family hexapeptide repeat protein n=2 Tax=Brevibacterium TaxID=1696 RepID=A0A366IE76_9MICO|nr:MULTISPECIES: acyltransferase [Brevibacterium]RBP62945.1 transferase family hexapeptide repeat protein [Brevibacterium sanguinis]RBP69510.1 transferase family hexapeptide repeat protein [Brevibacterium celere]
MKKLTRLDTFSDDDGNVVESPTVFDKNIAITIRGRNNRIVVDPRARIKRLLVVFDCDNGTLVIGPNARHGFAMNIRIGQDSTVKIGADVTTTTTCIVSAVEGATVEFGDDVMIASDNEFRADDGHPIFEVDTGLRVNPVKDIRIGSHVWFGAQAAALGGAVVGDGSVIGFRSVVTRRIPNNCIAVGTPAKVVRRHIAWERPHLSFVAPPYKPDISSIPKSEDYWMHTEEDAPVEGVVPEAPLIVTAARPGIVERILERFGYEKVR